MKITANRKNLLQAVRTALKAVGNEDVMEELGGLLVEAEESTGIISITGSCIHTQIQCRLRNEHILEGGSVVMSPMVADMLKVLDGETVEIGCAYNRMEIKSGTAKYNIAALGADKYPKMQIPFPEDFITVKGIHSLIKRTAFATDPRNKDASKRSVEFVKLSFQGGNTVAEATNGHIAAISQSPHASDGKLDVVLHESALNMLTGIVSPSEELYVGVTGYFAVFMKEDLFFASQIFDGDFIEGSKLMAYVKPKYKATVDAGELYGLASNVTSILSGSDDQCVNLVIKKDRLTMQTKNAVSESRSGIKATGTVPTGEEGYHFNPKWLLNCLKQASGPMNVLLDEKGYLLLQANQSMYCVCPRRPVHIRVPEKKEKKPKEVKTEKKTKPKKTAKAKTQVDAAA